MPDLLARLPARTLLVYLAAATYVAICLVFTSFAARALLARLPAIGTFWPIIRLLAFYLLILFILDMFLALIFAFVFHGHIFAIIRFVTAGLFFVLPATLIIFWIIVWFSRSAQLSSAASLCISSVLLLLTVLLLSIYVYARFIEPHRLQTTFHRINSPKLAGLDSRLRIVLLADIQAERITDYEHRVLRQALRLKPDLILLAGDYLQCPDQPSYDSAVQRLQDILKELDFSAPLGVFAVHGHSERRNGRRCFQDTSVRWLSDHSLLITRDGSSISLTGLALDTGNTHRSMPDHLLSDLRADRFNIFLSHVPDFVLDLPPDHFIDLALAGHTHGGQICLPLLGPLVTFCRIPRSQAHGLHRINNTTLCISRGLGMERGWAPPLRFLCPPEIVVLDLSP